MYQQYKEKRQFIRIPLTYITVEIYSDRGNLKSSETCNIIDISENGMKFVTEKSYMIKQPIHITFVLPESPLPIQIEATVVYQQSQSTLLQTGIKFSSIGLEEYAILKKFIENSTLKN